MKYLYKMGTTDIIVLCDFNEFGVMAIIIANFSSTYSVAAAVFGGLHRIISTLTVTLGSGFYYFLHFSEAQRG